MKNCVKIISDIKIYWLNFMTNANIHRYKNTKKYNIKK